jgi:hypothetical protein
MMALHPDHVADLRRSGLTNATIERCRFEAVPPSELNTLAGVNHAYRVPYFLLDGSVNGFIRLRLFPPRQTPDGHTQKYHQPIDTTPHLYLPPLHDWKNIAAEIPLQLVVAEGEKKAAAGCQAGLHAIGIGGAWCWREHLDSGERLPLADLDQFLWKGRAVELVPDSDAWRSDKRLDILAGFYALGRELQSRGATVRFVKLLDVGLLKQGLDDFLLSAAPWPREGFDRLERIELTDPTLKPLAAWYRRWKERQAERALPPEAPTMTEVGDILTFHWKVAAVSMTFQRLREDRSGIKTELTVTRRRITLLDAGLNLLALRSRKDVARQLGLLAPAESWAGMLDQACSAVKAHLRAEEPAQRLSVDAVVHPPAPVVEPILYERMPTMLFAGGGAGKGYLSMAVALAAETGISLPGLRIGRPRRVGYLDYESDWTDLTLRSQRLLRGHPELGRSAEPLYRRMTRPLADDLPSIARLVAEHGLELLIVDSLAPACGTDLFLAESATRLFSALRRLPVTPLLIAHVAKNQAGEKSIYGSVFFSNLARSVWEVQRATDTPSDLIKIALHHRKCNFGRLQSPLGLEIAFSSDDHIATLRRLDLQEEPTFSTTLPLRDRIRAALAAAAGPMTANAIAEELAVSKSSVKARLNDGRGRLWVPVGTEGRETLWGLLAAKRHREPGDETEGGTE